MAAAAVAAAAAAVAAASAHSAKAAASVRPQPPAVPAVGHVTPSQASHSVQLHELTEADRAELELQAEELAAKSLASLPEQAKAAKLPIVKAGILKRLLAQAQAQSATHASVPLPASSANCNALQTTVTSHAAANLPDISDDELDRLRCGLRRPPTELPAPQDGVEACGDDPWFADGQVRLALCDAVQVAHSQFKILVGDPSEEIARICPRDGYDLRAGAVLRLGGSHLGGFGEADVTYAYRQLSRALHPDKNPNNPDAAAAFRKLKDAQGELTQSLNEARTLIQRLAGPFQPSPAINEEMTRPQQALFAEATRLIAAVLALATEGQVPAPAQQRAGACLRLNSERGGGSWAMPAVGTVGAFVAGWFTQPALVDLLADAAVRSAYDCAPKRYRAQFLCFLARVLVMEGERSEGCVRQTWSGVWEAFPELQLWQQLRHLLQKKCEIHGREKKRDRSRSPRQSAQHSEADWSTWARRWRRVIRAVLPGGEMGAAPWSDPEVRKLCAALWRDFVDPLEKSEGLDAQGARRCLGLFRADRRGAADVAAQHGAAPAEWAFVPAADLLLIVGAGSVGVTVEGVFADSTESQRLPFASAIFQTLL